MNGLMASKGAKKKQSLEGEDVIALRKIIDEEKAREKRRDDRLSRTRSTNKS